MITVTFTCGRCDTEYALEYSDDSATLDLPSDWMSDEDDVALCPKCAPSRAAWQD